MSPRPSGLYGSTAARREPVVVAASTSAPVPAELFAEAEAAAAHEETTRSGREWGEYLNPKTGAAYRARRETVEGRLKKGQLPPPEKVSMHPRYVSESEDDPYADEVLMS
jgi:hypothetical protein